MLKFIFSAISICCLALTAQALEINDAPYDDIVIKTKVLPTPEAKKVTIAEILADGDETAITELLQNGFDVNARDENGTTPLIFVLRHNNDLNAARKLIEAGADVNAPDAEGMTPLLVVALTANELKQQQKELRAANINRVSALAEEQIIAYTTYQMERTTNMLQMLIEAGADVNQETPFGTPLMAAATNKWNLKIVTILLDAGARINAQDQDGNTALFYARAYNSEDIETLLIKSGADINLTNRHGLIYMDAIAAETNE